MNNQMDSNMNQNQNMNQEYRPQQMQQNMESNEVKTNTVAIVGFILSFFLGIVGTIVSIVALCQIKKTKEKGKGFAIAGIIIGLIPLVAIILVTIFVMVFVGPATRANVILTTACSNIDVNGNYYNSDENIYCENYVCTFTYNGGEYSKSCFSGSIDYE